MGGGYQSDVNIEDLDFVGDFPIENSLGGYGETTGPTDDYELTLDPPITGYRVGMHLQMKFNHPNAGAATLDVDGQGVISIQKVVSNALADLDGGDLNITRVYDLIYDGAVFQVTSGIVSSGLPQATEVLAGVAEIATQVETDAGIDDTRMITPQKMAQYVATRITGLWDNQGLFDCSTDPDYPAGQEGDAYTVSVAGRIGGVAGPVVSIRDVFYCLADNAGGSQLAVGGDWGIIQANLVQATESVAGIAQIATNAEAFTGLSDLTFVTPLKLHNFIFNQIPTETNVGLTEIASQPETLAGIDDVRIVTPLKLQHCLDTRNATESQTGLAEIATQAEVNTGLDDTRVVTALKLATLLNNRNASEILTGLAEIATQAEVNAGVDDTRVVTPLKLATRLASALLGVESNLGNPPVTDYVLASTNGGVRSWRSVNSRLFTSYGTFAGLNGVLEVNLGSTYNMPAAQLNVLAGTQALEINISGVFLNALGNKTLRVYIGIEEVFTYTSNIAGHWSIRILGGRANTDTFKGEATIIHGGSATSSVIQTSNLDLDTTAQLIRITHQNAVSALGQLNRFTFMVRHIV